MAATYMMSFISFGIFRRERCLAASAAEYSFISWLDTMRAARDDARALDAARVML